MTPEKSEIIGRHRKFCAANPETTDRISVACELLSHGNRTFREDLTSTLSRCSAHGRGRGGKDMMNTFTRRAFFSLFFSLFASQHLHRRYGRRKTSSPLSPNFLRVLNVLLCTANRWIFSVHRILNREDRAGKYNICRIVVVIDVLLYYSMS